VYDHILVAAKRRPCSHQAPVINFEVRMVFR
jgi:hypothetical protein